MHITKINSNEKRNGNFFLRRTKKFYHTISRNIKKVLLRKINSNHSTIQGSKPNICDEHALLTSKFNNKVLQQLKIFETFILIRKGINIFLYIMHFQAEVMDFKK